MVLSPCPPNPLCKDEFYGYLLFYSIKSFPIVGFVSSPLVTNYSVINFRKVQEPKEHVLKVSQKVYPIAGIQLGEPSDW